MFRFCNATLAIAKKITEQNAGKFHLQHARVSPLGQTEFIYQFILIQDFEKAVLEHFNIRLQLRQAAGG